MKKMFRSPGNWTPLPSDLEQIRDKKSMTIPGESYSIKEVLTRNARGLSPAITKNPIFDDDPDFDNEDPTRTPDFDLADATEFFNSIDNDISERKKKLRSKNKVVEDSGSESDDEKGKRSGKGKGDGDITASIEAEDQK